MKKIFWSINHYRVHKKVSLLWRIVGSFHRREKFKRTKKTTLTEFNDPLRELSLFPPI